MKPYNARYTKLRGNAIAIGKLMRALFECEPMTISELSEECGLHMRTVLGLVRALRREELVHVADWQLRPVNQCRVEMYKWAPGKQDARRPPPLTGAEREKRKRDRQRERKALHSAGAVEALRVLSNVNVRGLSGRTIVREGVVA